MRLGRGKRRAASAHSAQRSVWGVVCMRRVMGLVYGAVAGRLVGCEVGRGRGRAFGEP